MRAVDLLRQLDERLLPRLARAVTRLGQRPARPSVLSWAALFSCTAVLLTAVWAIDDRPTGDRTAGDVTRVGVVDGDSIPAYLHAAAADLAALPEAAAAGDGTYALISLSDYLTPQRLATVVGDVRVAAVIGRVPLPDRQTEIIRIPAQRLPDDVTAAMAELADRKDREAADYRRRAAALGRGGPSERELRQVYASGAEVASAEAAAYRSGCACVYALVVHAEPAALRGVASRPGVRAVDPAPEVRRLERTVFTPPLPEQGDVVRPPADPVLTPDPSTGPEPVVEPSAAPTPAESPSAEPEVAESSPPAPAKSSPAAELDPPSTSADAVGEGSAEATL